MAVLQEESKVRGTEIFMTEEPADGCSSNTLSTGVQASSG